MSPSASNSGSFDYDVLVVGGGPAGATAALRAASNGQRVAILEKASHPRFHIGESLLPRQMMLVRELGLEPILADVPRVPKRGASFAMGDDSEPTSFPFSIGLVDAPSDTLNVERAGFDRALAGAAVSAGATLFERAEVRRIDQLDGDGVRLTARVNGGERGFRGRFLLDASGQSTVVGRHLGIRERLPDLERVAYFGHFEGVERDEGELGGYPLIVMCREGWFWLIPIDERRTSVGLVMAASVAKQVNVPPKRLLAWGIENCPLVRNRTRNAVTAGENHVIADFSYRCSRFAGPGYFLVGDAATFVDPIFSTGVSMAMMSGVRAADAVKAIHEGREPVREQRDYSRFVDGSSQAFLRLVRGYYRHSFRELFLNQQGPFSVHRAVISVLCGHVFPKPSLALRWRLRFFELAMSIQGRVPLVPRRPDFSLVEHAEATSGLLPTTSTLA